jgi:decaprenylphospho-beta-D-ribofuranose 2-oxidase
VASTSTDTEPIGRTTERRGHATELSGWGNTPTSAAYVTRAHSDTDLADALREPGPRGVIARGLGRSYGDPAINAGGQVVDTTGVCEFALDPATGVVRASAGASLDDLIRALVPHGWFVPVTPGTRFVTVGGAIASDIHGKNHHSAGSWCQHVRSMRLALPDGSIVDVSPTERADLFWATAGGMGLTGIVVEATFQATAIGSSRIVVDTDRAPDLDTVMALMDEGDRHYDYSVAWIDLLAKGRSMGRSVLDRGRFARVDELPPADRADPFAYRAGVIASLPPVFPNGLLNPLSVKAFNELWYRKAPKQRTGAIMAIPQFFHPLDMLGTWSYAYGPEGFFQWQCVVPLDATETMRHIIERLVDAGCGSLVNVLKRFGDAAPGHLSFPAPGWTLSVDVVAGHPRIAALLDQLDERVAEVGGRLYLAKDSRMRPELLDVMYPRLAEWRAIRAEVDPHRVLQSDMSRRLGL